MTKKIFFVLVCIYFPLAMLAQSDTSESKTLMMEEILIQQGNEHSGARAKKQPRDLQTSTEKVLQSVPGVNMIRRGNFAQEPTIRGLNGAQINVTIDGMMVFGACTDKMDPVSSYIEPNNLQSIAVSYGANDIAYGSSIGGGIDFKLKQPKLNAERKWSGLAGLGYESNGNGLQTLGALSYSGKKLAVNMNGIFRTAGNYRAGGGEEIHFSQYNKWNGGVSLKYRFADHHQLLFNYIQDEGYNIGYPALTMDVAYAKAKMGSALYRYHSPRGALKYWEAKGYYNFIDHAMDDTKRPPEQVAMHMDMPGTSRTVGFYTEAEWEADAHTVKAKVYGYQNRLHAEMTMYPPAAAPMYMLTLPDAQRDILGLDVSSKLKFSDRWQIGVGALLERSASSLFSDAGRKTLSGMYSGNINTEHFLYNVYLNPVFEINKAFSLSANVSRAMRAASLRELYGFYLYNRPDGYDYLGNPFLRNERSWNVSLAATWRRDRIKIEGQVFGYYMTNYIAGVSLPDYKVMTIGANGVKEYQNIASALLTGVELAFQVPLTGSFTFSSSNTYTYGSDKEKRALPLISPWRSVNEISYACNGFLFSATANYAAAQKHVNAAFYGETKTPAYMLVHLKAGKNFKWNDHPLSVNVGIDNLFDEQYADHMDVMKVPQPGRNLLLHITYGF